MEENIDHFVIFTVGIIVMNKLQELVHLVPRNRFPGRAAVHEHAHQLKSERVLVQDIIVYCHLESGTKNTSHALNRRIAPAVRLQFDQEELGVLCFDFADFFA